jgi:hypothetical protein
MLGCPNAKIASGLRNNMPSAGPQRGVDKMCTLLNNIRILNGDAELLCQHGYTGSVYDREQAWYECPESCPGRLRVDLRVYLPMKIPSREEAPGENEGGARAGAGAGASNEGEEMPHLESDDHQEL